MSEYYCFLRCSLKVRFNCLQWDCHTVKKALKGTIVPTFILPVFFTLLEAGKRSSSFPAVKRNYKYIFKTFSRGLCGRQFISCLKAYRYF